MVVDAFCLEVCTRTYVHSDRLVERRRHAVVQGQHLRLRFSDSVSGYIEAYL